MAANLLDSPLAGFDADAVEAAVDQVRGHLGWHLAPATIATLTLDGPGTDTLLLPSLRVTAIASIVEDGTPVPSSSYAWSTNGVVERLNGPWTARRRGLVITLTHGYDSCPPAVRQVVARIATGGYMVERLKARVDGPFQRIYDTTSPVGAIDPYSERILDRYRLPTRS